MQVSILRGLGVRLRALDARRGDRLRHHGILRAGRHGRLPAHEVQQRARGVRVPRNRRARPLLWIRGSVNDLLFACDSGSVECLRVLSECPPSGRTEYRVGLCRPSDLHVLAEGRVVVDVRHE